MTGVPAEHRQEAYQVRLEWGPTGAQALGGSTYAVVVDVLSFTTTLTVAVERGMTVWPFPWRDDRAAAFAAEHDAVLAVGRLEAQREGVGGVSLSPAAIAEVEGVERIVLPSPNGSTISALLADSGATVVGGCLRNASALGRWLAARLGPQDTVAVIPAGERWPDGSLRPAVEDLWGAGAVVSALLGAGVDAEALSPEARIAGMVFAAGGQREALLAECASGRELAVKGFASDVTVAAEVDASGVVPVLVEGAFRGAR